MFDINEEVAHLPAITFVPKTRYEVVEEAEVTFRHGNHVGGTHHVLVAGRDEPKQTIYLAGGTTNHTTIQPHGISVRDFCKYRRLPPEQCTLPHLRGAYQSVGEGIERLTQRQPSGTGIERRI